jgi:hypothetical protein
MTRYNGRHRAPADRQVIRRAGALGLLASTSVTAVMFIAPAPVSAQSPDRVAWWNSANLGDPAPAPPAPPDVADGDLLVQGSNTAAAVPDPLGGAPASSQAVAGLQFDLPPTALVGALTLTIDGSPPPQVSVVACKAKETFTSADNGPWSEVPPYDGDACVPGKLKGNDVVFTGVDKLVAPDRLGVLLLPGPVDRVVFKPPNDKTLVVKDSGGIGAAAPPIGAGTGSTTVGGGAGSSGTASVGGSAVAPAPTVGLPDSGTTTTPGAPADQAPVVAGSDTGTGTPVASQTPAAADSGLSTRDRRIIALIVIAAEVLGYALLMRNRAPAPAALAAAPAVAGGRLRAPDRLAGARAEGVGGVGRFRRERQGLAPHL